jgi:hypothetical protein
LALRQIFEPHTRRRGLPILHLNGFKIANPTVLARISSSNIKRDRKAGQVSKLGRRINGSFLGPTPT